MNTLVLRIFLIYFVTICLSCILMGMVQAEVTNPAVVATVNSYKETMPVSNEAPADNGLYLFGIIIAGAIGFLFLFKYFKANIKQIIFAWEVFYIFYSFMLIAYLTMIFLGFNFENTLMVAIPFGMLAAGARVFIVKYSNVYAIVISAVIAVMIAQMMTFESVLLFGALMIVYDIIAVGYTKHMLIIAKEISQYRTAMLVTVTDPGHENDKPGFDSGGDRSKSHRMDLGAGDLFMSSMLVAFSMTVPGMWLWAFGSALFGFVLTIFVLYKLNRPIPALPTIIGTIMLVMVAFTLFSG